MAASKMACAGWMARGTTMAESLNMMGLTEVGSDVVGVSRAMGGMAMAEDLNGRGLTIVWKVVGVVALGAVRGVVGMAGVGLVVGDLMMAGYGKECRTTRIVGVVGVAGDMIVAVGMDAGDLGVQHLLAMAEDVVMVVVVEGVADGGAPAADARAKDAEVAVGGNIEATRYAEVMNAVAGDMVVKDGLVLGAVEMMQRWELCLLFGLLLLAAFVTNSNGRLLM
ncbi:hypothetical protein BOTBODRAFT_44276 [Botryobasidium botryosum FD-172 SS1]|uniref:Uncharacterized protein n=1 Tax=Botryobasidium botryosum (strain FD-172 SS1) TaxID=930990 RepID=A0A067MT39_BOTB1|nr:hypothetical protein BOTBODRAFT_44276 [Botryobasidium botryosum FD-172 SS1]